MAAEEFFDKIDRDVAVHGFSVIGVMAGDGDPPFSYTVGFKDKGWPEVVVVGFQPEIAHGVLWCTYDALKDEKLDLSENQVYSKAIFKGYKARFDKVEPPHPLMMASRFWKTDDFEVRQLVWPDEHGVFPDEEGCNEDTLIQDLPNYEEDDDGEG